MASIILNRKSGTRRVQILLDGKRPSINLGKCTKKQAAHFKINLENLLAARFSVMEDQTARWVAGLPDEMYSKLAKLGLLKHRETTKAALLGETLDWYVNTHKVAVKHRTFEVWSQAQKSLNDYFGADKSIGEITKGDADLWRLWMVEHNLAEATIRKRSQNAKQFMRFAIKHELLDENPFSELKSANVGNDERLEFIPQEKILKVMEACPDYQWRLIFALCRFGGLRCPSEVLSLRWQDINWEQGRMTVTSPKTERYKGKGSRVVPIFGELRPYLQEAFDNAKPGAIYCIERYRGKKTNLGTQAHRIIKNAGLKPWPRTYQNLRASRETELTESFPLKSVTEWIGHSPTVANRHYLSVPDSHYEKACALCVQQTAAKGENEGKNEKAENHDIAIMPAFHTLYNSLQETLTADGGN